MPESGQGDLSLERKVEASGGMSWKTLKVLGQTSPSSLALSLSAQATSPLLHRIAGIDCVAPRFFHNLASLVDAEICS